MPLIVFLHGAGETPQAWSAQVAALPPAASAVAPWLRGTRPGQQEKFTVTGAADEVLGLLTQNGEDSLVLIGASLGAVVALDAAIRAPEAVSHLILCGGQVNPPRSVMRVQRTLLGLMPRRRLAAMGVEKDRFLAALDEAAEVDYRSQLGAVTARTLVLVGERDRANTPAAKALADGITGARLAQVPGAGHTAHTDNPAAFNALAFGFLAQR